MADDVLSDPPPQPDTWSADDGRHLRGLREAARIDRVQLARQCTLSTTQLQQLEDGGDSAFYSPSIKLAAGLRVLDRLGGTRPARSEPIAPSIAPSLAPSTAPQIAPQTASQIAPLTAITTAPPTANEAVKAREAGDPTVAAASNAPPLPPPLPATAGAPEDAKRSRRAEAAVAGPASERSRPRRARTLPIVGSGLAVVLAAALLVVVWPSADKPKGPAAPAPASTPSPTSAQAPSVASTVPATGTASMAGAPSGAAPAAESRAPAAPDSSPSRSSTTLAASPAEPPGPQGAAASPTTSAECAAPPAKIVDATPPSADRTPDYVFLVAKDDLTICLQDATQAGKPVELSAGKGLKVMGEPPFVLSGDGLARVDVYFQGNRIRAHQGGEAVALRLLPR